MRPASSRVHPTREDPVLAALSPVLGGPMGDHGAGHRWWTPLRVVLALTTLALALGMVAQVPCERDAWQSAHAQHAQLCASAVADSYLEDGLVELVWPFTSAAEVRRRYDAPDLPVLTALWAHGAARLTHALSGSPDVEARGRLPRADLAASDDVRREQRVFMAVNAVGLALLALLAAWCVGRAAGLRRPWDAAAFAGAPLLVLTWLTDWVLLPVAALAGLLLAWRSGRRTLAAALAAVALLAWVPVGGSTDPGAGSVWLLVAQAADRSWSATPVLVIAGTVLAGWCAGVAALARRRRAGVAEVVLLVLVGVLLVAPQAPPSWSLLLLPAAALAVRRWRDLLVWQLAELVALLLTGLYLGEYLAPTGGGEASAYWLAIALRVAGQLWLAGAVLRDLLPGREGSVGGAAGQPTRTSSNQVAV